MFRDWIFGLRKYWVCSCAAVLASAGFCQAGDNEIELRFMLEAAGEADSATGPGDARTASKAQYC